MAKLVYLDPGHAKSTPGKRSFDSTLLEYEFNRDVASRMKYLLEKYNINVKYTTYHETSDLSLTKRCVLANNDKADIFVSIHANAAGSTWNSANGWEIYVYRQSGEQYRLAKCIHKYGPSILGLRDRGIRSADFGVLRMSNMPAVLIEHGFYSNKQENEKLKSADFRHKCAVSNVKGILEYFGIKWKDDIPNPEPIKETPAPVKIKDEDHWAYASYTNLKNKIGDLETRFDDSATRAEFMCVLARLLELNSVYKIKDIDTTGLVYWADPYRLYLNNSNIKIEEARFNDIITRAEAFVIISKTFRRNGSDIPLPQSTTHWAEKYYIDITENFKLPLSDKRLEDMLTRGEMFALLNKLIITLK